MKPIDPEKPIVVFMDKVDGIAKALTVAVLIIGFAWFFYALGHATAEQDCYREKMKMVD